MHCHKNVCEFTSTFRLKVEYVAVKQFSRFVTFRYLPSYTLKIVDISGPRGGDPPPRTRMVVSQTHLAIYVLTGPVPAE